MQPDRLDRLAHLLGAIAAAESQRLGALASEAAACRAAAAALREQASAGVPSAAAGAGDLALVARWRLRLLSRARAADERAQSLAALAEAQRRRSARADGRARTCATLAETLKADARRHADRQAEGALALAGAAQSPGTGSGSPLSGSPGTT